MAQHFLDGAQVGTAFEQLRGKRVAECVWADGLFQADFCGKVFDDGENHYTRHFFATAVQEQNVLIFAIDIQSVAIVVDVERDGVFHAAPDGNQPLLAAFTFDFYITVIEMQIGDSQIDKFRHTHSAAVECLKNGSVAVASFAIEVDGFNQLVNLFGREHCRQLAA